MNATTATSRNDRPRARRVSRHLAPRIAAAGAALFALAVGTSSAAAAQTEVNVNVVMSAAGRKVKPPTPAKPAYYFPVVLGFRQEGLRVAGEIPPPAKSVVHQVAKVLADRGYLVVSKEHPDPDVLIVLSWGAMNPLVDERSDGGIVFYNANQMLALVGGEALKNLDLMFEREPILQGAREERYFTVVSAYDFAAVRQKKKVLLWQARMSTPSSGVTLDQVIPALLAAGAPLFGQETQRPKWVMMPIQEGTVKVGEPKVIEDRDAPAQPVGDRPTR